MHGLWPSNNHVSPPSWGRWTQREDRAGGSLSLELTGKVGEGVGQATVKAQHCDSIEEIADI